MIKIKHFSNLDKNKPLTAKLKREVKTMFNDIKDPNEFALELLKDSNWSVLLYIISIKQKHGLIGDKLSYINLAIKKCNIITL